jgi:DNA replication protein DnaC
MPDGCSKCAGSGRLLIEGDDRVRYVRDCSCVAEAKLKRALDRARIPQRYQSCSLNDYVTDFPGSNKSLVLAHLYASSFVQRFPVETGTTGVMMVGSIGVGKTHLAVAILKALILERGASGLFCDYRELLKKLQNSYSQRGDGSEADILAPILSAQVLVLDELGAAKPTEWVTDTIGYVLNSRYNDCRTTIITTNYANLPAAGLEAGPSPVTAFRSAVREETLGDRIGERIRSRLQEMCVPLELHGRDFRQSVRRADSA